LPPVSPASLQQSEYQTDIPHHGRTWSVAGRIALVLSGVITIVWAGGDFRAAQARLDSARQFDSVKVLARAIRETPKLSKAELEKRRKELLAVGASEKQVAAHCRYLRWFFGGRIAFGAMCALLLAIRFCSNPVRIAASALGTHLSFSGSYAVINTLWPAGELEIDVLSGLQLIAIEAGVAMLLAVAVYFAYRYVQTSESIVFE
jgi:uncharacterized membrane protein